jgi:hypothetical protein
MALAGLTQAFAVAGMERPRRIVWCDGPDDLADAWNTSATESTTDTNCSWHIFDRVLVRTESAVDACLARATRRRVGEIGRSERGGEVASVVADAFSSSLSALPRRTWRPLPFFGWQIPVGRPRFTRVPIGRGFGQHTLSPLGAFEFLHDVCGLVEETRPLRGLWMLAKSVGWVVPNREVCWLVDRPDVLKLDALGRLHAADGPALRFRDGWSRFIWKGIPVSGSLIESSSALTPRMIDRERDPVLRRCMIEILTPQRYIAMGGAARVAQDETGVLWRKLWWGFDAWAAVEVVNGSPEPDGSFKHYFLQVPPTMRTAREAVAWTYGLSEREYANLRGRT